MNKIIYYTLLFIIIMIIYFLSIIFIKSIYREKQMLDKKFNKKETFIIKNLLSIYYIIFFFMYLIIAILLYIIHNKIILFLQLEVLKIDFEKLFIIYIIYFIFLTIYSNFYIKQKNKNKFFQKVFGNKNKIITYIKSKIIKKRRENIFKSLSLFFLKFLSFNNFFINVLLTFILLCIILYFI